MLYGARWGTHIMTENERQTDVQELGRHGSPAAERARRHRERKRNGLRMVSVEIFEQEIERLETLGLLGASYRSNTAALKPAIERVIECVLRPKWLPLIGAILSEPVTK